MVKGYEADYYDHYDIGTKTVSYLESPELRSLHAAVARELTAHFHPKTVLDAGCAMGVLVSEFVKQGVEAYGLDLSEYAVENTDPLARGRCFQGSLAEPFPAELPAHFDLVTCMEVVEHMSPAEGRAAIANLCRAADTVIFCSTPDDFEDKTHINVQEREYWAACFAENGFFDDLEFRPLFLTPYAVCYRKRENWVDQLRDYERFVRESDRSQRQFRDEHYQALEREHEKAVAEWTRTDGELRQLQGAYAQMEAVKNEQYRALEQQHEKAVAEWTRTDGELRQLQTVHARTEAAGEERYRALEQAHGELKTAWDEKTQQLQAENDRYREELRALTDVRERLEQDCSDLGETLEQLQVRETALKDKMMAYLSRAEQAEEDRTRLEAQLADLNYRYSHLQEAYDSAMHTYQETYNCLNWASARVQALESSASWRAMAPVRWLKRRLKRLIGRTARLLFRAAKKLRGGPRLPAPEPVPCGPSWPPQVEPVEEGAAAVAVNCRRLGIYTIYDADGIVDDYVLYYLKALKNWVEKLVVVSNGPLKEEGWEALASLGCQVLVRENTGFDAWGIKYAIDSMGFETLGRYDEVVISNNTLFGPVRDLKEMFTEMAGRKVDFWGITAHAGAESMDIFDCNPYGILPEHIQSFFYVVRSRLVKSEAFRRFWTELPQLPDYTKAVGLYESVMTRYFSDAGFAWDTYMAREDYYEMTDNPLITMPMESIRDWNCPFFKRRAFFQDYFYLTVHTDHQSVVTLMQYLQEETDYPFDMVWKNLIRTCHMSDLSRNMQLARIFDRDNSFALDSSIEMPKAALFMHLYDQSMAPELAEYASSMPPAADIFISTVSEEKKTVIAQAFSRLPNRVEIRVLPNRGRDVSALLTSFRDVVMNYDVACVTHDKKTGYLKPQTVGEGFAYMGYENILGGRTFVDQVIQAFARDPFLGLLYCPDPSHADFCAHIGLEWLGNFEGVKNLAADLKLHVPMDQDHPPMAPYGSNFWFRTAAMKPLFDKEWTYEDFPAEPVTETDGTIMHAIERIYPYVAQHAGFYSALLMTADYASVDIGNLSYYAQQYSHVVFESGVAPHFVFATVKDAFDRYLGPAVPMNPQGQPVPVSKFRRIAGKIRRTLTDWAYLM